MPSAPQYHRPSAAPRESAQSSRQTAYRHWYNTPTWRRLRAFVIHRDKGLCQECKRQGTLTPLVVHASRGSPQIAHVDHKKPHAGDWNTFSDETNLETLCATHHSEKTLKENNGGSANPSAPRGEGQSLGACR